MMLAKSSEQEKMKDKRVYLHVDLIPKVIHLKLFLDMVTSSYVDNVTTSVACMVSRRTLSSIHVNEISIAGLVFFCILLRFLKLVVIWKNLKGVSFGMRPIWEIKGAYYLSEYTGCDYCSTIE